MKKSSILSIIIVSLMVGCGNNQSTSSNPPHKYDSYDFRPYQEALNVGQIKDDNSYSDEEEPNFVIQGEQTDTKLQKLSFLQINDTHGAIYDDNDVVGISHVSSIMNEFEKENGDYIGILGGDIFQGGWLSNITRGSAFVDVLNSMNFDAFVIGNHEFDWRLEEIAKYKDGNLENGELNIPFLGANIYYNGTDKHPGWIDPFTIINSNGYKVGVIGIIGESQYDSISSDKSAPYEFKNTYTLVSKYAKELRSKYNCDSVVLATHDYSQSVNERFGQLEDVKIDAIFNAHTHEFISEYVTRWDGYEIPCVQSGTKNANVGTIVLNPEDYSIKPTIKHYTPSNYEKDDSIESIINKYQDTIDRGNKKVGYTNKFLSKRDIGIKVSEYMTKKYEVLGAFVNQSGVRGTIGNGDITHSKCYEVFPFDNIVYIVKLPGNTARKLLTSSSYYSYTDPDQTIVLTNYYYLAVIDFLYIRESNEFHFKNTTYYNTKTLMRDDFVECCQTYFN